MHDLRSTQSTVVVCCLAFLLWAGVSRAQQSNVVPASFSLRQSSFIENKGQLADQFGKSMPEVLYTYNANGLRCYLTESGMNFIFSKSVNPANSSSDISDPITRRLRLRQSDTLILRRLDMRFAGANPHPRVEAIGMTNGYFNYYLANCSLWGVHGYSKIVYHDLYPNIDLTIYTTETSVKYDFIVHPGGDPNVIAMQYSGMDSMSTSADGKFRVFTPLGTMEEDAPYSYQLNQLAHNVLPQNVAREEVPSGFAISDGSLRFRIGSYDKSRDLVIDPVRRMWGTYFGGNTTDNAQSPVVDKGNNIIFCGTTTSNSAIATSGAVQTVFGGGHDAYLAKFTTDGALIWATYYGGSSDEFCGGVALDSSDNLILYGETHSASGIATVGSHQTVRGGNIDAFLAKFDNTGARQWATYFGGDGTEAVAGNRGVAVDHGGHIYITGSTSSTSNLATVGAMQTTLNGNAFDNFLARFNSTGSLLWATYYGGAMDEYGLCLAAENTDLNFYVGGYTASTTNISTTTGFQANYGGGNYDGFIAKFNSQFGAQIWASYCGGPGLDYVTGLCIDTAGQIYGCGYSSSASNISTPGTYQPNHAGPLNGWDAFIVKLNPAGQRQWATYYGGSNFDYFEDIIPNGKSLLLAGETVSPDGITTSDAYQPGQGGGGFSDGLLAKFDFNGAFQYGSYYGGPVTDYGSGCVFDRLDKMILTGQSSSTSGIASPGAFKTTGVGGTNADGYVVKFCVIPTPVLTIAKDTICKDGADTLWLVPKYDHTYWYDGSTPLPNLTDKYIYVLQSPQTPGLHSISVFASNGTPCEIASDTVTYYVDAGPVVNAGKDTAVCPGDGVTLNGSVSGGIGPYNSTVWLPTTGLSNNKILNPKATPAVTTKYHLYVTDEVGCTGEDSMTVVVRKPPQLNPKLNDSVCIGMTAVIGDSATGGQGPYTYLWSPITRLSSYNVATPTVTPIANSTYTETVTDANGCQTQVVIKVTVVPPPKPVVSGPNSVCINSTEGYTIKGKKGDAYFWSLSGGGTLTNSLQSDSVTILWTTAGVWIITVSDTNAQGCIGDSSYTVTVSSTLTPDITPSGNVSYCKGDSVILYASKGYATYRWSDGSTLDSLVVKQSGSYSVAVTSSGGCSGTSNPVNVTENPSPVFTVTADGPTHLCPGSSVHLTASSGFDKYVWSSGETTPMITVTSAGTYTVQVTNSFGCSAVSPPIAITIDPNLTPVITPDGPLSFCMGDSVTLDAGAGYSTYQWSKDGAVIPSATSEKLTVVQSGSYTVAVTSGSCSGTSVPTVVTVFPLPAQPVITQSGTTLSSTPATTYQWLLNGTKISGATAQTLIESQDGSYTVTITDANGCSNTSAPFVILSQATATVRVGQVPTAIPGGKVEVPIELVTSQNLIPVGADHYKGTLRYNGTMLVPTGSSGGSVSPTSAITGSTDRTVGFDGRSAPMTSGTLQKIQFDAMLGNDTCTTLTIDTFYWTDASVAVTREDGDFCETGICVSGGELRLVNGSGKFGMSPIRPNPSVSHIRIEYDLIETGRTKIALMDLLGREVKIVRDEDEKPGHYAIDVSLGEMSSGYYLSTLRTPTQITMQPFVLQK